VEILYFFGASILKALAATRLGPLISAVAVFFMAIAAANESRDLDDPLKTFFVIITMVLGSGAAMAALVLLVRVIIDRNIHYPAQGSGTMPLGQIKPARRSRAASNARRVEDLPSAPDK
jgi:hypothetical protein